MAQVECTFILLLCIICCNIIQTEGFETCGRYPSQQQCYGSGAYCCGLYNDECCWETVYSYWWFWFVWFWVFLLILTCSLWICIRRRRRRLAAQPQYVVVDQHPQYGTVGTGFIPGTGYVAASDNNQGTLYPQSAPPYTPAPSYAATQATAPGYQEKPPPYSAAAGN